MISGRKQSASRVALLTGLHRKEVGRMMTTARPEDQGTAVRVAYSEQELKVLLKRSGLRVLATYGTLERTPFNGRSPRMVVLAERV